MHIWRTNLNFLGGKIEAGETPEQALIRELQEEVGITPTQVTLFDSLEYQFPDRQHHAMVLAGRKLGRRAVGKRRAGGTVDSTACTEGGRLSARE
ncbi:7,8-dihydro-8-oxoguanine-triphosphatase [Salmonella bongori]|nr:7,8-dihydro-8-oxoguanine-triphosphatase [Salmonella bongori]